MLFDHEQKTRIRLAHGTAWIVIVPAEMLGVDSGLGYAILDARDRLDYPDLVEVHSLASAVAEPLQVRAASSRLR